MSSDTWHECDPTTTAPFEGRDFVYGVYYCYSLISDYLLDFGVELPEWDRGEWGEWNTAKFTPSTTTPSGWDVPSESASSKPATFCSLNLGDHPMHTDHVGVFTNPQHFLHHPAGGKSRPRPSVVTGSDD